MKLKLNFSFNKVLMYSAAALLAVASAYSIPKEPCDTNVVCCEKPQPGPFAFSYPKDVGLSCPRDFYVYGDFLFMRAAEDGLDYAIDDNTPSTVAFPLNPGDIHGMSTQVHRWDWNMGARFGFGFYLNHDQWNIETSWMYFRINNDKSSYTPSDMLAPLWVPFSAAPTSLLERASERWTANMNVFDLMLGKPFHASRYFVLNPNFGLRAAWIDQDLLARYSWNGPYVASPTNLVEMRGSNDFWGVGLRGGLKAEFILGNGWELFSGFNLAMLFSKFDVTQYTLGFATPSAGDFKFRNSFFTNVPNFDLVAGINYGHFFSKNKYKMTFNLAYEFQEWFQQNHFRKNYSDLNITYNQEVPHGDLTLNGFSFRVQVDL